MFDNNKLVSVGLLLMLVFIATFVAAQDAKRGVDGDGEDRNGKADEIKALIQRLNSSGGDSEKIEALAGEVVAKEIDVAQLVATYSGTNLIKVARKTDSWPLTADWTGKDLPGGSGQTAEGAKAYLAAIESAASRESYFPKEVQKYIGDAEGGRTKSVALLLEGTVKNYSTEAIMKRAREGSKKWPFPFCLPNCD